MSRRGNCPVLFGLTIIFLLVTISGTIHAVELATPQVSSAHRGDPLSQSVPAASQVQTPTVPSELPSDPVAGPQVSSSAIQPATPVPLPVPPTDAPARPSSDPVPALLLPTEEKQKDRVLSQGEVDLKLLKNVEEEREADPSKDFFVSVQEDDGKKDADLYAGLMGRIEKFIRYFQTRGRDRFELYLTRSGKYGDMMRGILAKYGLPGDLIYLALIESGFSPKAYSVARAAGPWQFIVGTGRRYGLRIDWWTDERRDYEKSTHAAASYLKDLYGMFDSWPLATAAYNAGEGKIQKAVARYKSDDYVELSRHRYLKQETKDYVPKMIAALTIAKEPERYGFGEVKYEQPLEFDKVIVPGGTGLAALGRLIGVPYDSLREWNPELRRFCTPPNRETYEIRLPKGYGKVALERMEEIRADGKVTFVDHIVKKGETLESLAERYKTTVPVLQELNGMKKPRIARSARLVIPVTGLSAEEAVPGKELSAGQVEMALKRLDTVSRKGRAVKVRKGEAKKQVSPASGGKKEIRHVVRSGDTLAKIAKVYGITLPQLSERNNLREGQVLPQGSLLFVPLGS